MEICLPQSCCHTDYRWSGNAGSDNDTGNPIIYDPSAFFGHSEYEIGIQKVIVMVCLKVD
jgi:fructosamine-3-kinase